MTTPADTYIALMDWHLSRCAGAAAAKSFDHATAVAFEEGAAYLMIRQRHYDEIEDISIFIGKILLAWHWFCDGVTVSNTYLAIDYPQE